MNPSRLSAIIGLFAVLGCRDAPTQAETQGDGTALVGRFGMLVQTVTITPASPKSGENVSIRSVIVNRGSTPANLESRICSLDFGGSLELAWPTGIVKCGGYSTQGVLAPGDSVIGYDLMKVTSPPGAHRLRVRHALDPEMWLARSVEVRAP